jgi:hypothetical protein
MTRFTRSGNGKYVVHSKSYDMLIGTRAQVWHGTAFKTSGGLTKTHLLQNKNGRIVSRSKHSQAKKDNRLVKSGYGTKKGTFGFVKLNKGKTKRGGATSANTASTSTPTSTPTSTSTSTPSGANASAIKAVIASKAMNNSSGSSSSMSSQKGGKRGGSKGGHKCGRRSKGTKKMRGGMLALSPHSYNGQNVKTSGVDVQFIAGSSG